MASNAEMRRLVLHAADRLRDIPGHDYIADVARTHVNGSNRMVATDDLSAFAAAVALAEQTLRMVAGCLEEDES